MAARIAEDTRTIRIERMFDAPRGCTITVAKLDARQGAVNA